MDLKDSLEKRRKRDVKLRDVNATLNKLNDIILSPGEHYGAGFDACLALLMPVVEAAERERRGQQEWDAIHDEDFGSADWNKRLDECLQRTLTATRDKNAALSALREELKGGA